MCSFADRRGHRKRGEMQTRCVAISQFRNKRRMEGMGDYRLNQKETKPTCVRNGKRKERMEQKSKEQNCGSHKHNAVRVIILLWM